MTYSTGSVTVEIPETIIPEKDFLYDIQKLVGYNRDLVTSALVGELGLISVAINNTYTTTNEDIKRGSEFLVSGTCDVKWNNYKIDPARWPMFKDVLKRSNCVTYKKEKHNVVGKTRFKRNRSTIKRFFFHELVEYVKWYDKSHLLYPGSSEDEYSDQILRHPVFPNKTVHIHNIKPTGFIFHESRCGSTLASNMLVAMDPDITRMYSESQPMMKTIRSCVEQPPGECNRTQTVGILRDLMYMMSRTNKNYETRLFFKFQPLESLGLSLVREAFPDTPWIFIYRDPYEVMASQFQGPPDVVSEEELIEKPWMKDMDVDGGIVNGNTFCSTNRVWNPHPASLINYVKERTGGKEISQLNNYEYCAANLGNFCEAAFIEHQKSDTGKLVNYVDLKEAMIETILPNHFNLPVGEEQRKRIEQVTGIYSKGKGHRYSEWKGDTERKQSSSRLPNLIKGSDLFLKKGYEQMELTSIKAA
eukprot:CAMPEP_0178948490 /NCGR_PEP_ID=MMETSP0789-20121207/5507_1 /TAXON_ID=3005 /ORGANISM="Rhizosolenia setigera, Strain CCMP 1694" /LENGTH=473 /DNA_ID=CAMNT_0020628873 /DNA_START=176 /DNA_END=1597 /DNA_ORIENTATION=-